MDRGEMPFHLKCALKLTHTLLKSTDFDQYLLITSQPLELAIKVQLSQIGSRPRAFKRAIDEVNRLPLTLPNGGSKSEFVVCVNKIKVQSNKVCYKVSLCEHFQRHSCSKTIPLSSDKYAIITYWKSTMSFPNSYRWSPYVTHNSPKKWLKKRICRLRTNYFIFP